MKNTLILVLFPLFVIKTVTSGSGVATDPSSSSSKLRQAVFGADEVSVSVKEGDSVTLHTRVQIQGNDLIEWRFNGKLIFRIRSSAGVITVTNNTNGTFGVGLKLDNTTGDLKITNFRNTDAGEYLLKIRRSKSTETTFSVKGVSDPDPVKSVTEGESITLKTQIQSDEVKWRFGAENSLIAEINLMDKRIPVYYDVLDGRFKGRLKLDEDTGSLTITDIRDTDSGVYEAEISSVNSFTIHRAFNVAVEGVQSVSVMEGDLVSLSTGVTEIQRADVILWKFGDRGVIARLNGPDVSNIWSNVNLNKQTGDLTINNIQSRHSGDYKVEIDTTNVISHRKYHINIIDEVKSVSVMEGDSVTLHTNISEKQGKYSVQWFDHQDNLILPASSVNMSENGDLTIINIRSHQSGYYKVNVIVSRTFMYGHRKFHINISGVFSSETDGVKTVTVKNGESVHLNTVTEIQADLMEWLFGPQNIIIAKTDGKSKSPYTNNDVRFENRLNLDIQTGNLTIENSNRGDSGLYQLKIINSTFTIQKRFRVTVSDSGPSPGAIAGPVLFGAAAVGVGVMIYLRKKSKAEQRKIIEVNGQNQEETELNKPTESVENQ